MLSGFASSLLQRVTGTDDPAVLKASWDDPSILQVLAEPSLVRAVEEIHENRDKLGKYKEVNEVVLAVRKVDSLTGLTGEEVPSLPEDWDQLRWYEKDWRIGRRLQEKGFCILKGSLSSDERQRAVAQADELRRAGGFERLPREVISGYFGEGSAWTRNLSPEDPQEEALRLVESRLLALGSDLAHCSVAFSGFRLQGHMPGMVHCSRGVEDQPNPGLADPDVANYYLGIFMRKKLKLFYFLGPNPALLSVCPATAQDESQVFRTVLQPGAMVVIRAEACSCGLFPSPSEPCTVVEVDFLAEQKHSKESAGDRMVPPQELQEWLLDRLKAIVDNDVQADVPEEWIKLARQTFVRSRPAKILEVSHRLPGQHCVWEEVALGGYDCITEIPPSKWEVDAYFDPDPAGADDYKMYTRHMGVVEGVKTTFSDSELADFGLLEGSEVDARQVLLYHSAEECLGQAGLGRKDTQGQSIGFFCGLSGNDRYFEWMSGSLKTSKIAASLMSSGGVVNRIAWFYGSKGPSMAVDTEESSGAAALDTAVAYLREDRCARAIVSGVNWIQLPVSLILCCATGMLSASGRGRAFDESADGNVRSEGVVSVLMEAHGRWRRAAEAEVDEFRPAAEEWDAELQDDMQKHRLLICGSALNSRGQSSSLLAPSSAAIQDLIESALKDAKCPASIVDGVEANAGGNSLSDAVELNILRRCLAAEDAAKTTTSSASVRATKTLIGEPGPPGGLACLARACFTLQKAVSGPLIHLRQLSEIAAAQADDDETLAPKLLLTTEAMEATCLQQSLGVSSFGTSGTSVHMLLTGSPPQPKEPEKTTGRPLRFFAQGKGAQKAQAEYHIIGSFTNWERTVKMEVESEGVFGFTLTIGENRWETFQIWEDGDQDKVLHPGVHWADRDASVLGPSRQGVCGRFATWRVSGKPTQVKLCNEDYVRHLRITPASEEILTHAGETEIRIVAAFPDDYEPEEAAGEIPVVEQDAHMVGMPGDSYRVRLTMGDMRRVDWQKLPRSASFSSEALPRSSYYVAGDFNFWDFQSMEEEHPSSSSKSRSFVTEVRLRSDKDTFQVVQNKDWDQAFYPEGSAMDPSSLRGPDAFGALKGWRLPGKAGDVFRIHFRRSMPSAGTDEKFVSFTRSPSSSSTSQELVVSQSYSLVGSWDDCKSKRPMVFDKAKSSWHAEVVLGVTGLEFFQFLFEGSWMALVYPSVNEAPASAAPQGPDSAGAGRFWRLEDKSLHPGDTARIALKVSPSGLPQSVSWDKIVS